MNIKRLATLITILSLIAATSISPASAGESDPPVAPTAPTFGGGQGGVITPSDGFRAGWVVPTNGARLENRDIFLDAALPLPEPSGAFWLFTSRAISRAQLNALAAAGVRYLGVLTQNCYAFERVGGNSESIKAAVRATNIARGTTLALPMDRMAEAVLPHYEAAIETDVAARSTIAMPHPLGVHFWARATAGEVRELIPNADDWFRLPTDNNEAIGPEFAAEVTGTAETLVNLAQSAAVSSIDFVYPRFEENSASRALATAGPVTGAPRNLDGTGMVVGEWDGGAVFMHNDFGGRVTVIDTGSVSSHATHVAGTILGSGAGNANARGFAPAATLYSYNFNGNVPNERRESKYLHRHEHDNHSWGSGGSGGYGGYATTARDFDTDSRDILLLAIKSAGNDGSQSEIIVQTPGGNFGYDSIDGTSGGKNILVIGSAIDNGDLSTFSARGPTNDGRIKPDVTANGQGLLSTYPNNAYSSISGTSMSAPSTTGVVTLMAQLHKSLNNNRRWAPDAARGVMMHTVRDVFNVGPDYRFGWGLVDADRAATLIEEDAASGGRRIVRGALRETEERTYKVNVAASDPELRLTLNWLDAYNGGTAAKRMIHDFDLIVESPTGVRAYPWSLDPANPHNSAVQTAPNTLDNIEQVLVNNPAAGEWSITVRTVSISDPDLPVQGFVLVSSHDVEGTTARITAQQSDGPFTAIPDNNPNGALFNFNVSEVGVVKEIRVHLEVNHARRGDLAVELIAPDATTRLIEASDTSTRRDLHGIYPDLRSFDDDTTDFFGMLTQGTWHVRVIDTRTDNTGQVRHLMLEIDVDPIPNRAPVADAGANQSVQSGDLVTLTGAGSYDPDQGQVLAYSWLQTVGPSVTLNGAVTVNPTFTAPEVTAPTILTFMLLVQDPFLFNSSDTVNVTVSPISPVIATIAPNPVAPGGQVTITGNGLLNSTVRISGQLQTVLSQTKTELVVRVSATAPVAPGQALSVENPFGSDAQPIDVALPTGGGGGGGGGTPIPVIPGEEGGGGGCAAISGRHGIGLAAIMLAFGTIAFSLRRRRQAAK